MLVLIIQVVIGLGIDIMQIVEFEVVLEIKILPQIEIHLLVIFIIDILMKI
jgi:hypothetical protein